MYRDYINVFGFPGFIVKNFGEFLSTKIQMIPTSFYEFVGLVIIFALIFIINKNIEYKKNKFNHSVLLNQVNIEFINKISKINHSVLLNEVNIEIKCKVDKKWTKKNKNKVCLANIQQHSPRYYNVSIWREKKHIFDRNFKKTDYTIHDIANIRDEVLAKYNHKVLLDKLNTELRRKTEHRYGRSPPPPLLKQVGNHPGSSFSTLSGVRNLVRSV